MKRALMVLGMAMLGTTAHAGHGAASPVRWSAQELEVLASMQLAALGPEPVDPSNRFQASSQAADLGRKLFFDVRLSRDRSVSCRTCHDPDQGFQDGRPVGRGIGVGVRRSMPLAPAKYGPWLFWDGRKDSLWSQALGPLEDPVEHGGNRTDLVRHVQARYATEYTALFGPLPDLDRAPANAGPLGTAEEVRAWQSLDARTREDISRAFADLGKAIAAYVWTLPIERTRFDQFLDDLLVSGRGSSDALDAREIEGLRLFIGKAQCASCHAGPLFSDFQFHNTGVAARAGASADRGRAAVLARARSDEFNCLGPFSDAPPARCEELKFLALDDPRLEGAFKTPSLRGVASRPPYMHAGQFESLEQVIEHYVAAPKAAIGVSELGHPRSPVRLPARERQSLVAFLRALSDGAALPRDERPANVPAHRNPPAVPSEPRIEVVSRSALEGRRQLNSSGSSKDP